MFIPVYPTGPASSLAALFCNVRVLWRGEEDCECSNRVERERSTAVPVTLSVCHSPTLPVLSLFARQIGLHFELSTRSHTERHCFDSMATTASAAAATA